MSEDLSPKLGPNASDAPEVPPENAKVFGYNVAQQVGTYVQKPNPNSPLAAG